MSEICGFSVIVRPLSAMGLTAEFSRRDPRGSPVRGNLLACTHYGRLSPPIVRGEVPMTTRVRVLIGFTICALVPLTVLAQKVSYDYDPGHDFSRLKTYAFAAVTNSDNQLVDQRIAYAIVA